MLVVSVRTSRETFDISSIKGIEGAESKIGDEGDDGSLTGTTLVELPLSTTLGDETERSTSVSRVGGAEQIGNSGDASICVSIGNISSSKTTLRDTKYFS